MFRSHSVSFFFISLLARTFARAIPASPTTTKVSPTESPSATSTASTSSITPISRTSSFDDGGEYFPPLPPGDQYYENEGADGHSTGSVKLSIGAEAGIIVAIVILGLAIMGSCLWFWMKKQKECKAMADRRRTLRTGHCAPSGQRNCSGGASPDLAGKTPEDKGVVGLGLNKMTGLNGGRNHILPAIAEKELGKDQSQLAPIREEGPEWPWWKRALPRQH